MAGLRRLLTDGRDQHDKEIKPGEGELLFDGCDIYWVFEGKPTISDTSNCLLDSWLANSSFEEITSTFGDDGPEQDTR